MNQPQLLSGKSTVTLWENNGFAIKQAFYQDALNILITEELTTKPCRARFPKEKGDGLFAKLDFNYTGSGPLL